MTGSLPPIEYTVDNGAGGTATARVLVGRRAAGDHTAAAAGPPVGAITVEENGTATYNVLDDYFSPAGDDLFLRVRVAPTAATRVSFRPDGTITYRNTGGGAGTDRRVEFVVSDGVKQATGTLQVAIASADSTTPVAYPVVHQRGRRLHRDGRPAAQRGRAGRSQPVVIRAVQPEPGSEGTAHPGAAGRHRADHRARRRAATTSPSRRRPAAGPSPGCCAPTSSNPTPSPGPWCR